MAWSQKELWGRFRVRLKADPRVRAVLSTGLLAYLRLVHATNRVAKGSIDPSAVMTGEPVIIALWHGRQFMVPFLSPKGVPVTALISRSADAELNAAVLERLGVETVRGSGGDVRTARHARDKNGVGAFKALVRALKSGRTVVMIADHRSAPRVAGEGIVRLARASGCPIVPVAYESSRRIIFDDAWDDAALNLPFGRAAIIAGSPIYVGRSDDLDQRRRLLTEGLNSAAREAESLCLRRRRPIENETTNAGSTVEVEASR